MIRRRMNKLPIWIAALWLALPPVVHAQPARPGVAPAHPAGLLPLATPVAPKPAAGALPGQAQAQTALDMLKDDAQRARLITVLEAIAHTPQGATPALPASDDKPPVIALTPNSVGAQLLFGVSDQLSGLSDSVMALTETVTDFPLLWHWITRLASDRQMQMAILDAAWRLTLVLGAGLVAEWLARRTLRRFLHELRSRAPVPPGELPQAVRGIADAEAGESEWVRRRAGVVGVARRLPYVAACLAVDLLPVLAVLAVSYGLLAAGMAGGLTSRLVILAVLNGFALWRTLVALARATASPDCERLRLIPITSSQAHVVVTEVAVLTSVALAGYVIAESALLFGLYLAAHDALLKLNALIVYVLVVRIVLRNRRGLKQALRAREGKRGVFASVRNILASAWHRIIIFYLLALWLVWALEIENGFQRLLRLMIVAVAVSLAARLLGLAAKWGLDRLTHASEALDEHYPGVESRLAAYAPAIKSCINAAITLGALVAVLQAWGVDVWSWFDTGTLGERTVSAVVTIGATFVIALVVWELVNAAIARHLAQLARNAQLARSARLRTLLPMFRTTLLVTVSLIAGLLILSEIGVNIAPLLAGASVIGLAIGFGSQKLVQDIITGLFLLLENTMQVGDVVTLGGLSGTVENLSIRTIRLRALDGAVHIVPFSAVTTVTNNTRDYGFAVADVSVGLNEEPDRISEILKDVAAKMRTESPWRGLILADLEVMGVEKFIDTAWVMRVRIKTLPASRWSVGRELNRRIKYRFDDEAIESPMTSYRALGMAPQAAVTDNSKSKASSMANESAGSSPLNAAPV